ncbi:MAG: sodium-dependent transporter [Parachlamydiaceae bacterium]
MSIPKQREHWGSHLGFILAAAGSAIGLGTLWKFPYVTGENGGGLFVLTYIFCTFFIGIPVFMAELILGRKAQRGAVGIFATLSNNSAVWKGVGWLGVITSFILVSFYSVLAGWGLCYVFMCLNEFYKGLSPQQVGNVFDILSTSGDITLFWHMCFMALVIGVVLQGIRQGVEYWNKFMTSALLILMVCLCIYSCTLDGVGKAFHFVFYPDFTNFKSSGILEALGLSFFTLSLGQGIMLTYGSYMRRTEDIPKTSFIIGIMIIVASLLAAMTIFPIIFTFDVPPGAGVGLVFKTLPVLFSQLPAALLLSTSFFILFVFTALTSAIAMVEAVSANFIDLYGWSRRKAVLASGIGGFVFGIPSALSGTDWLFAKWPLIFGDTFFSTVNDLISIWFMPIGGLMVSIYTGWFLDKAISRDEFQAGSQYKWLWGPWLFFMRWVAPVAILLILMQQAGIVNVDAFFQQDK